MFRVMQGGRLSHIFMFCCSNFVGLFDTGDQSHNTVYTLHRFMLGIYCMTVSQSCIKGKRVLPNPWHKRLRHINNLCKRKLGTIMLRCKADISYDHCTKVGPQVTFKLNS